MQSYSKEDAILQQIFLLSAPKSCVHNYAESPYDVLNQTCSEQIKQ